jgi:hypothetical protein
MEFLSRPPRNSQQAKQSAQALGRAMSEKLVPFKGDLCGFWSWLKSTCRFALLLFFPGSWHQPSLQWLRRWSAVAPEVEVAGCRVYGATSEAQADVERAREHHGIAVPVLGMGASLELPTQYGVKITKRKGVVGGCIQPSTCRCSASWLVGRAVCVHPISV